MQMEGSLKTREVGQKKRETKTKGLKVKKKRDGETNDEKVHRSGGNTL